jgi:hypothetical protein
MCRSQTAQRRGESPEQYGYSERFYLDSTLALLDYHNPSGNNARVNQANRLCGLCPSPVIRIQ